MGSSERSDGPGVATPELDGLVRGTEFFRSLVENSSDAIVSVDENSTILYANGSVERILGYDPEELVGERLTAIMPDRLHADHFEGIERYLETGERSIDWNGIELPAEHANGHEVPLSITFEEHVHDGSRVFSGIMRDISDRVEREEKLERFASIVSHDLRDPLQTARATTAVARAGDESALDDLEEVFDRMEALIDDVLTLAKQGEDIGETGDVDLEGAAEDAWSTAGADPASLSIEGPLGSLSADEERLRTLFENLFSNAVEHGGPTVTVRVGRLEDAAGFYVEDDGPGFGEEDPDDLFEYGYTTAADNTGFGLSIVADIAGAHGWSVVPTESETGGARFEVLTR